MHLGKGISVSSERCRYILGEIFKEIGSLVDDCLREQVIPIIREKGV